MAPFISRVLLVDDDEAMLESLWLRLRRRGFYVATARSGLEAVEAARLTQFDVAVVDLSLPDVQGHSVGAVLRAPGIGLRVIALTGDGRESAHATSIRLGFDAHLVKPAPIERLVAILTAVAHRD